MKVLIQKYLLGFWVWWYWFFAKKLLLEMKTDWIFTLGSLNLVPMAVNIFNPMFKDNSFEGRLVAFPIRFVWVIISSALLLIYTLLIMVGFVCYLVVPLLPLLIVIWSIF